MSSNKVIDTMVETAANNFEEPIGEFGILKKDMEELAGLDDHIEIMKALEERSTELGKTQAYSIEERGSEQGTWLYIGWQLVG